MTDRRTLRPAGWLNLGAALFVALLVAAVALRASSSQPPAIAEFAPQAQQQIKQAPLEQTGDVGRGEGDASGAALPSPSPTPPLLAGVLSPSAAIDPGRVRKCIGNPPRQIEDPQSPPCVPYFTGKNGGATWQGVTDTTIGVMFPDGPNAGATSTEFQPFLNFINTRFELYGRTLVGYNGRADSKSDPAGEKAAADSAADNYHAFASVNSTSPSAVDYYQELGRRGLMATSEDSLNTEPFLAAGDPHLWQYEMAQDRVLANIGQWACARLAGRPAAHAGDPLLTSTTRVFGLAMASESADNPLNHDALDNQLAACGIKLKSVAAYQASLTSPQNEQNVALQLKTAGVTTVFCLPVNPDWYCPQLMRGASNQAFLPEWIVSSPGRDDRNLTFHFFSAPSEQTSHMFGLTFTPRQLNCIDEPMWWAGNAGQPGFLTTCDDLDVWSLNVTYRALLLLASGIQMAGPNLNPTTFAAGLHRTTFPNPETPSLPGKVGFPGGSHTMTLDGAEIWWSNTDRSVYPDEQQGAFCYVDRGARHTPGSWPTGPDPFFQRPCFNGGG